MKKILIHAGHGKTGSSAIQKFLNQNREPLKSNGIWYPAHRMERGGLSSGNYQAILRDNGKGGQEVDPEKIKRLLQNFEASEASIMLLSSEVFFLRMSAIAKAIPKARFIVYLRDPLSYAESAYNQMVKRGDESSVMDLGSKPSFGILRHLESFLEDHERERLLLRYFHPACLTNGDILQDFLQSTDISLEKTPLSESVNTSYSFEALELKRQLNYFPLSPYSQYRLDQALQAFDSGITRYSLLSGENYERYRRVTLQQLQLFFRQHPFPGHEDFLEAVKNTVQKPQHLQPSPAEQLEDILRYLRKQNPDLYSYLARLLKASPVNENLEGFRRKFLNFAQASSPLTVYWALVFGIRAKAHKAYLGISG